MKKNFLLLLPLIALLLSFSTAHARSILLVGDSLTCGSFGQHLLKELSQQGNDVTVYCAVSSAPTHWLKGLSPSGQKCQSMTSSKPILQSCDGTGKIPTFETLLKRHPSQEVIVALGTNSLAAPKADATYAQMAKMIKSSGRTCTWIAPPHMNIAESKGFPSGRIAALEKNLNSFYDSLAATVDTRCQLIDSRDATATGTPGNKTIDGVHRSNNAGKHWAQQIAPRLSGQSRSKTQVPQHSPGTL